MSYKVTISGGTVLEKCIQHVAFNVDTDNDRQTPRKFANNYRAD